MKTLACVALALACEVIQERLVATSRVGRTLHLEDSLLDQCFALNKVANVLNIEQPGSMSPLDSAFWDTLDGFCKSECDAGTELVNFQCVRPPTESYLSVLDMALEIDYSSIQGYERVALYEFAFRIGSAIGVPVDEVSLALLWSAIPTTEVVEWRIARMDVPLRRLARMDVPLRRLASEQQTGPRALSEGVAYVAIRIETLRGLNNACDLSNIPWGELLGLNSPRMISAATITSHAQKTSLDDHGLRLILSTRGALMRDDWHITTVKDCSMCYKGVQTETGVACSAKLRLGSSQYLLECEHEFQGGNDIEVMMVAMRVVVGNLYQSIGVTPYVATMARKALTKIVFGSIGENDYYLKRVLPRGLVSSMPDDYDDPVSIQMIFAVLLKGAGMILSGDGLARMTAFVADPSVNGVNGTLDIAIWAEFPAKEDTSFDTWTADFATFEVVKKNVSVEPPLLLLCTYRSDDYIYPCACPLLRTHLCPQRDILASEIPSYVDVPAPPDSSPDSDCPTSLTECNCLRKFHCRWTGVECDLGPQGLFPCDRCSNADLCNDACMRASDPCTCLDDNACVWSGDTQICATADTYARLELCAVCSVCLGASVSEARRTKCEACLPPEVAEVLPSVVSSAMDQATFVVTFYEVVAVILERPLYCAQVKCRGIPQGIFVPPESCSVKLSMLTLHSVELPGGGNNVVDRTCTLTVFPWVRDLDGNILTSLITHEFTVVDGIPPRMIGTIPSFGGFALNEVVQVVFDETVNLADDIALEDYPKVQAVDNPGDTWYAAPADLLIENRVKLTIRLQAAMLRGNVKYALSVPKGVIRDVAGNIFVGMSASSFQFIWPEQTVAIDNEVIDTTVDNVQSMTGTILLIGAVGVAVLVAGGFFMYRYVRGRNRALRYKNKVAPDPRSTENPEPDAQRAPSETPQHKTDERRHSRTSSRDNRRERENPPSGSDERRYSRPSNRDNRSERDAPSGSDERPSSRTSTRDNRRARDPPGGSRPEAPGFQKPVGKARDTLKILPTELPNMPVSGTARSIARKIEKDLRASASCSPEERKKLVKGLLLEYHPDKNDENHAKEVFQFVNATKELFL